MMKRDDKIIRRIIEADIEKEKKETMYNINDSEKELLNEYEQLWQKSAEVGGRPIIDADKDWQLVRTRMGFSQTKSKRIPAVRYFARIAALVVLALGLSVFLIKIMNQAHRVQNGYITHSATSEKNMIELPDGSKVMLNKNSSLQYSKTFNEQSRDVILTGEAFFEVARNESLSFKVFVESSVVEVLGTSFNIRSVDTLVYVSVTSGLVKFYDNSDAHQQLHLRENQDAVFSVTRRSLTQLPKNNINEHAWHSGYFEFNSAPLSEVIINLADYYNLTADERGGASDSLTFTGVFDNQSLDEIIQIINLTLSSDVELVATGNHLLIRRETN